jgi:hypothetical protein
MRGPGSGHRVLKAERATPCQRAFALVRYPSASPHRHRRDDAEAVASAVRWGITDVAQR